MINRKFVLARRPQGIPQAADFRLEEENLPLLEDGQMLIQNQFISVDPGMRAALDDVVSYAEPVAIGGVIPGATVGVVAASRHPKFEPGMTVAAGFGWQTHGVSDGRGCRILPAGPLSPSTAIGVLGIPGLTAYFGLLDVGKLKAGETLLVTSAAGAVGSAVAQIARIKGARAIGIAGGKTKCQWLRDIGLDHVIDYQTEADLGAAIDAACPQGIDVFFDNIGNEMVNLVLPKMARFGRIVICGQVADYNVPVGERHGLTQTSAFISQRLSMAGFVAFDYAREFKTAWAEMTAWIVAGQLRYLEDITPGFERLPEAFIGLFSGQNFGRKLILAT